MSKIDLKDKYPYLSFQQNWLLSDTTQQALGQCTALIQAINELPLLPAVRKQFYTLSLIKGAQATTAIEGNSLTFEQVQQIVEGKSLNMPSKEYQEKEVRNIFQSFNLLSEMLLDSQQNIVAMQRNPLIDERFICQMHSWVVKGLEEEYQLIPGQYRQTNVHVGQFRPPDYSDVPELMAQFVDFLRSAFRFEQGKQSYIQGIIQAIVAHVYLEVIHPFSDGNGRTGRLLEFYILLRCGLPQSCCHLLSNFYNDTRHKYYRQLKEVSDKRSLNGFLEYAIIGLLDKLKGAFEKINESIWELTWKQHVYETFDQNSEKFVRIDSKKRKIQLALFLFKIKEPFKAEEIRRLMDKMYFSASGKTIERDLEALAQMGLVLFDADQKTYTVNTRVLEGIKQLKRPNISDGATKA